MRHTFSLIVALFVCSITSSFGQKIDKTYEKAEDQFYSEKPAEALLLYKAVLAQDENYEDAAYKAELCSLLSDFKEKPLDQLTELRKTSGKDDKFYLYWLGRIYTGRYDFTMAIQSWKSFLKQKGSKSKIIIGETKDFIKLTRDKINFFDNTDNYLIHNLDGLINSEGAELSPVYFPEKQELLFASSRGSSKDNEIFKIYHAIKQDDGWTDIAPVDILGDFNRETANLEVVNEDGKLFIFKESDDGDLFYSETNNGKWTLPVEFDANVTSTHLKSHFFINEHEDRIIFATDRRTMTGSMDLYQTFRDATSGKWSKPAPFAPTINSEYEENSPYLSPDEQTLYFSSKGHSTIGGYDIFKSEFDPVSLTWSEPENLGFPINSPDDEMNFKMNPDGKSGYFSSNRLHTKGDYDIYFFWEIEKINIEGRVFDMATQKPIANGQIQFTPSQYTDEHFKSATDKNGKYITQIISDETYLVEVTVDNEVVFTDQIEIHETGGIETTYIKDFLLNRSAVSTTATPDIIASTSDKQYNVSTPQPNRIAINANNNTSKSLRSTREDVADGQSTVIEKSQAVNKGKVSDQPVRRTVAVNQLTNYSTGDKAIIHNVYFGFGATGLSSATNTVLDELYQTLKSNPSLKVEVSGHTDNIGTVEANQWISENRAKAVVQWLVQKGINSNQLVARGYGESKPLASNDDEENGRELNRRIEVLVIK
ncbi:MAG: OmpA family protein [Cyclobacteriaceae bacterium]